MRFPAKMMAFVAAAFLLFALPNQAQAQKRSLKQISKILDAEGYGTIETNKEDNYVSFKSDGNNILLFVDEDKDIQFYAGFITEEPDCGVVNLWNREHRFSRAYVDDEGDYVIESDHLVAEKIADEEFALMVGLFVSVLNDFQLAIKNQ